MKSRQDIYIEIEDERERQEALFGRDHDIAADADHWWNVIDDYNGKYLDAPDDETAKRRLVQIAALAVAALETYV